MSLGLDDCNPGLLAYIHWDKKYPPIYASMSEMGYVDGLVMEYCIHSHDQWRESLVQELSGKTINKITEHTQDGLDVFTAIFARSGAIPPETPSDTPEKTP